MDRRQYLTALGSVGVVATAGCSAVGESKALLDPNRTTEAPSRQHLEWTDDSDRVAGFGADGTVSDGVVSLSTELSHRSNTEVTSITLRVWMPDNETDTPARVAVVSPVEGDSSPPPTLSLYSPERARGTVIEVSDLDDLADETISTLDLVVRPIAESATEITIAATIEIADTGALGDEYTLEGNLELSFPALAEG